MGRYIVVNGVTHDLDALSAASFRRPSTAAPTKKTVGSSSTTILAANENRNFAIFVNDSNEVIYLSLSGTAVINEGIRLNASGGAFEINFTNMYIGAITAICASGSKNLTVTEA